MWILRSRPAHSGRLAQRGAASRRPLSGAADAARRVPAAQPRTATIHRGGAAQPGAAAPRRSPRLARGCGCVGKPLASPTLRARFRRSRVRKHSSHKRNLCRLCCRRSALTRASRMRSRFFVACFGRSMARPHLRAMAEAVQASPCSRRSHSRMVSTYRGGCSRAHRGTQVSASSLRGSAFRLLRRSGMRSHRDSPMHCHCAPSSAHAAVQAATADAERRASRPDVQEHPASIARRKRPPARTGKRGQGAQQSCARSAARSVLDGARGRAPFPPLPAAGAREAARPPPGLGSPRTARRPPGTPRRAQEAPGRRQEAPETPGGPSAARTAQEGRQGRPQGRPPPATADRPRPRPGPLTGVCTGPQRPVSVVQMISSPRPLRARKHPSAHLTVSHFEPAFSREPARERTALPPAAHASHRPGPARAMKRARPRPVESMDS